MPFTDKQFEEFIKAMDTREMLIRIDENTKNFHQNMTKRLDDHIASDYSEFGVHQQSVSKAHARIDNLKDEIKSDITKSLNFQNWCMGGLGVLVFIVPIAVAIWLRNS